jgi:hypothetical protein
MGDPPMVCSIQFSRKEYSLNPLLYRTDAWFDSIYERSKSGYIAIVIGFLVSSVILTGISTLLGMPGSLAEAFLGGTAGVLAFVGARGMMMHYYRIEPDTDRPVLRERLGPNRAKFIGAAGAAWLLGLVVLGAQGVQSPAVGALTIVFGLTVITLLTKTPEEKTDQENDETYWSSDPEFFEDEDYEDYDDYEEYEESEYDISDSENPDASQR